MRLTVGFRGPNVSRFPVASGAKLVAGGKRIFFLDTENAPSTAPGPLGWRGEKIPN